MHFDPQRQRLARRDAIGGGLDSGDRLPCGRRIGSVAAIEHQCQLAADLLQPEQEPVIVVLQHRDPGAITVFLRREAHHRLGSRVLVLLAAGEEGGIAIVTQPHGARLQLRRAALEREPAAAGVAQHHPVRRQLPVEFVAKREPAIGRHRRRGLRRQIGPRGGPRDRLPGVGDPRPAILPAHRHQEGLAPGRVEVVGIRPHRKEGRPPFAVRRGDQLGMPRRSDRIGAVARQTALGQDRVGRIGFIGARDALRAQDHLAMPLSGAPLGTAQIIIAVLLEDVRPLDPDRLLREVDAAVHQHLSRADRLQRLEIELLDPDRPVTLIFGRALGRAIVEDPGLAVGVEEQRRVDATLESRQPHRIRPWPGRILCCDHEISAAIDAGVEDVESPGLRLDRRREHAARQAELFEVELLGPIDRVADLRPADQVAAAKHRDAGEIAESRRDEIEVLADAGHARVGIKALQDRIAILIGRRVHGPVHRILTAIFEPVEARDRLGGRRRG